MPASPLRPVVFCLAAVAGDHARVADIVSEVERRDLRAATSRLHQHQQSAGSSTGSPGQAVLEAAHDEQQQLSEEY